MPVELKVLGYAALLQYVQFVMMALPVNLQLGVAYTMGNRDRPQEATGVPGRLKRALENHYEALALFTIAVIIVTLGDASNELTQTCAWVYLWSRILYIPAYASGIFMLRSTVWSVGFAATAIMLIDAIF